MSRAFLFHYLKLNMFRTLIHPSSGAYDYLLSYFMGCIALVRCVLMQTEAELQPASTHIIPEQYNP